MKNTFCNASPHLLSGRKAFPDFIDVNRPDSFKRFGLSSDFEGATLLSDVSLQIPESRFVTFCPHLISKNLPERIN